MSQGKVPQNRTARWLGFLSAYDFKMQHISGTKNNAADSLSRIESIMLEYRLQLFRLILI